jgi:membrane protease YdiL (CAAX protease family)
MPVSPSTRTVGLALLVEGGLGVVALGIGWLIGFWPAIGISLDSTNVSAQLQMIGLGVLATLPPLVALWLLEHTPLPALESVRQVAEQVISRMFPNPRWWQLAIVSLAAGFGEELLFRGLAQAGLERLLGGPWAPWIALAVASLVFGAFHYLNATYAILATIAGLYFGWLLIATGSLWPPIVAHALYDFVALSYLLWPSEVIESPVEESTVENESAPDGPPP